jgi:hypothetical protein
LASPLASLRARHGAGPLLVAAALPLLLLHRHYQPQVSVGSVDADLSDLAVAVVVCAAAVAAVRSRRLAGARPIWAAWGVLAVLVLAGTAWGATHAGYPTGTHLTTAAKWIEYMLLAPAFVLLVRRAADLVPAAVMLVLWSCAATAVGALQFVGALGDLDDTPAGRRKPSFLGYHDFAALSAAALLLALLVLARGARSRGERRLALAAGVAGGAGVVLGGPLDALLGTYLAVAALVVALRLRDPRRLVAIGAVLAALTVGVGLVRSSALADGLKFLGVKEGSGGAAAHVQSYRQRALLAYIGGRIFLAQPLLGVGWQGSSDPFAFEPYLAAARRRFDQPAEAFPSRQRRWGVQNAYVQSLADLGALGLPAFLAALLVPAVAAYRRGAGDARMLAVALLLLVLGVWNGYGLVAGIPLAALTWLAVGLAAASTAFPQEAAR